MRGGLVALAVIAVTGCSFIGANVPDQPPPPAHCPEGVIALDVAGSLLFLLPATVGLIEGSSDSSGMSWGPSLRIFSLPAAIIGTLYLSSAIYGLHENGRCQRMKAAAH